MKLEYTVAVNGEIDTELVLTSKREARQTLSDWKTLSKGHGYGDRFQIMVREVGPWKKLEERK